MHPDWVAFVFTRLQTRTNTTHYMCGILKTKDINTSSLFYIHEKKEVIDTPGYATVVEVILKIQECSIVFESWG